MDSTPAKKEIEFSPLLMMMKQREAEEAELFSVLLSCALKANKELDLLLVDQQSANPAQKLTPTEIARISKASVGSLSLIASYANAREQLMERHSPGTREIRARVGIEQPDGSKVVAEVEVGP